MRCEPADSVGFLIFVLKFNIVLFPLELYRLLTADFFVVKVEIMNDHMRRNELIALKEIAETLNIHNDDMQQMLNNVLKTFLKVTNLPTGWIFLIDDNLDYTCSADYNLPPALRWGDRSPMTKGDCWCLQRFREGNLKHAVNIIECKRLTDAVTYNWGDTNGISHHATVPLESGGETFGILNVAKRGNAQFEDEELALLQSVAYQIGTAVKLKTLYEIQEKSARSYAKLGSVIQNIGFIRESDKLAVGVVNEIGKTFDWPTVGFFVREGDFLSLRALYHEPHVSKEWSKILIEETGPIGSAFEQNRTVLVRKNNLSNNPVECIGIPPYISALAVPLRVQNIPFGILFVSSLEQDYFDLNDMDIVQRLADYIALTKENIRLDEQRGQLVRMEERNRLARDLHDSVSQKLFSLSLLARGAESALGTKEDLAAETLEEIQRLAQDSLKEMRALIRQLRPAGLEQGLSTALKKYGNSLGLVVHQEVDGVLDFPRAIEETFWRIGQEALNNVKKHSGTNEVKIIIRNTKINSSLEIVDRGHGFTIDKSSKKNDHSMGMSIMRERADMVGGTFSVVRKTGGTTIKVTIPRK